MKSAAQTINFEGIELGKGEQRIEVIRSEGGENVGAWQVVVEHR